MSVDEFIEWVEDAADEVDEYGFPRGLEQRLVELEETRDELKEAVRRETEIKDILLPKPEHKVDKAEAQKILFKRGSLATRLSWELTTEYLRRELSITNFSKRLRAAGEISEHLDPRTWRRNLMERAYADAAVGV
jgi:hypothetical protein